MRDEGLALDQGADIWPLYRAGDARANRAVGKWLDELAASIELLRREAPFGRMILGGGVSESAGFWLDELRRRMNTDLPVEAARLGARAGLVGAYAYVWGRIENET